MSQPLFDRLTRLGRNAAQALNESAGTNDD